MNRAYHDQNLKKILCVITDYAIAAYRMTNHQTKKSPLLTGVKPNEQCHWQVTVALILNRT